MIWLMIPRTKFIKRGNEGHIALDAMGISSSVTFRGSCEQYYNAGEYLYSKARPVFLQQKPNNEE